MDYSGSMSDVDLSYLEAGTAGFCSGLDLDFRGEIIKFDSNVSRVQGFTDDRDALVDAIESNHSRGSTALWDAVLTGIEDSEAEEGRFQVAMAFTDGQDNSSRATPDMIFDAARESRVPVFIAGMGDVDVFLLNALADDSNGLFTYLHSSDQIHEGFAYLQGHLEGAYMVEWTAPEAHPIDEVKVLMRFEWEDEGSETAAEPTQDVDESEEPTPEPGQTCEGDECDDDAETEPDSGDHTPSPSPDSDATAGTCEGVAAPDAFEANNTADTAFDLGTLNGQAALLEISLPDAADEDWFSIYAIDDANDFFHITIEVSDIPYGAILDVGVISPDGQDLKTLVVRNDGGMVVRVDGPGTVDDTGLYKIKFSHESGPLSCGSMPVSIYAD